jgi:cell division protein ZapA
MPQVTVTIAGKLYRMACDDGQEQHLYGLADRLDNTINDLRGVFGEIGDQRLTVMSAITVLDQLNEAERRLRMLETEVTGLRELRDELELRQGTVEARLIDRITVAAERVEDIAQSLGRPTS